ncbi:MAG: hypothetical protein J6N55_00525 [Anaerovibrio sp.]|uniref:hypothetical protein n=1 Tax=Anaerovibrio sp. TaxID=1872532 RepID=UPI001B2BF807|nr:hypothetical protein [Anaerovibrio sp.]MBO6244749.1 hypothetical protein [Anaerovibrio sp.]
MNADEAKKRSEQGAINAIEKIIEEIADKGFRFLDLSDYDDLYESVTEEVMEYFKENGYKVTGSVISW